MKTQRYGIEIEMTGLTRKRAAEVVAEYFGSSVEHDGGSYDTYVVRDSSDRQWKLMSDGSINCQRKVNGQMVSADREYSVELVSPICKYEDIEPIQEIVRNLRKAGAVSDPTTGTGIHVHVDASPHNAKTLRNLANIMRAKEDILYKALQVDVSREHRFCKKVDDSFLDELNRRKPQSKEQLKNIWYNGRDESNIHYSDTRYRALNLHSVFQKGTIEYRLYNGCLHAGKIKSYLQLSLAISHQALTQKSASPARTISSNEKFTFRTWLLRMGLIGKEFETARLHLLEHLEGNIAWKNPESAEKQKQMRKMQQEQQRNPPATELLPEMRPDEAVEVETFDEPEQAMTFGYM